MSKIMIVDDEYEICDFLKEFFLDRKFEVVTTSTSTDVLRILAEEKPHILLLDIKMPGIDGLEILKQVKATYPQIKVIMVTAVETQDKMDEAFSLGADNYITKPLSLEYLEKDIRERLGMLLSERG